MMPEGDGSERWGGDILAVGNSVMVVSFQSHVRARTDSVASHANRGREVRATKLLAAARLAERRCVGGEADVVVDSRPSMLLSRNLELHGNAANFDLGIKR